MSISHAIVDYAEANNIGLIVVGTRDRSGIKRVLLGSVASATFNSSHARYTYQPCCLSGVLHQ